MTCYMKTYIITFYSHFSAIAFHKEIKKIDIQTVLMPIPRHLSSSCGTCVKINLKEHENLAYEIYDGIEKVFLINREQMELVYES